MNPRDGQRICTGALLAGLLLLPCRLWATPADPQRDPFWPPDYVPVSQPGIGSAGDAAVRVNEIEWRGAERRLQETVKGVTRLPNKNGQVEFLAQINGRSVGVGEVVSLSYNNKIYRWKIVRVVLPDGPVFERLPGGLVPTAPASPPPPPKD